MNTDEQFDVADVTMFHNTKRREKRKLRQTIEERETQARQQQIRKHRKVESMLDKVPLM